MRLLLINTFLLLMLFASLARGDLGEFERYIVALENLSSLKKDTIAEHIRNMERLDPERIHTDSFLKRIYGENDEGFSRLKKSLGHEDYYRRVTAARLIMTYSPDIIKKNLAEDAENTDDPEVQFQAAGILHEIDSNYYYCRERLQVLRMNLLMFLASVKDERFLEYAVPAYTEGDRKQRQEILGMVELFGEEERLPFLSNIFSRTEGELRYDLFRLIRNQTGHAGVRDVISGIIRDRTLPLLLRTQAASVYRNLAVSKDNSFRSSIEDPFLGGLVRSEISLLDPVDPEKVTVPPGFGKSRLDGIVFSGTPPQIEGRDLYIHALTAGGNIWCHTSSRGFFTIPVSHVSQLFFTPTGKRGNDDFYSRLIFKNGDSLSGVVRFTGNKTCSLQATYLKRKLEIPLSKLSVIQFNTEQKKPELPVYSENVLPVIKLAKGDTFSGSLTEGSKGRIRIRPEGVRVFSDMSGNPLKNLIFDTRDIDSILLPGHPAEAPAGTCTVVTMFNDRLTANLIDMDPRELRLYSSEFGLMTLQKDKILSISIQTGYKAFNELIVAAFSNLGKVQILNEYGQSVWEMTGLKRPVYAERTSDGRILICERDLGNVLMYSSDRILLGKFTGFRNVSRAHALGNGHILVCSENAADALVEIDSQGNRVKTYPALRYVSDAVVAGDGAILIASSRSNRVYKYTEKDGPISVIKTPSPVGIQILSSGDILVSGAETITEYSAEFVKVKDVGTYNRPFGFYADGCYFIREERSIIKLDRKGDVIRRMNLPSEPDSIFLY